MNGEDFYEYWVNGTEDEISDYPEKPVRISKNPTLYRFMKKDCTKYWYQNRDDLIVTLDFDELCVIGAILQAKTINEAIIVNPTIALGKEDDTINSEICYTVAKKNGIWHYTIEHVRHELMLCQEQVRFVTDYKDLQEDSKDSLEEMLEAYRKGTIKY